MTSKLCIRICLISRQSLWAFCTPAAVYSCEGQEGCVTAPGGVPSESVRLSIGMKLLQKPKGNPLKVSAEDHGSTKLVKDIRESLDKLTIVPATTFSD